jgi:hypothetical protein
MKQSEINTAITTAKQILNRNSLSLPPFACWTPEDWQRAGPECDRIKLNDLGWAVTDFGLGDFVKTGVVMFTLRNGNHTNPAEGTPYAEKLLILLPDQRIPLHLHWKKTEDIINRGGSVLIMKVHNSSEQGAIDQQSPVRLFRDGIERYYEPGQPFELQPGESVTITPGIFHTFANVAGETILICGEVSTVSDAKGDNLYGEEGRRFMTIEADTEPVHLLSHQYP